MIWHLKIERLRNDKKRQIRTNEKLADLWYQQQKIKYTLHNKRAQRCCMTTKSDLSRQAISRIQKYTKKIISQKRGLVNES